MFCPKPFFAYFTHFDVNFLDLDNLKKKWKSSAFHSFHSPFHSLVSGMN